MDEEEQKRKNPINLLYERKGPRRKESSLLNTFLKEMKERTEEKRKTQKPRILFKEIYPLACTCNLLVHILQSIQDTPKTKKMETPKFSRLKYKPILSISRFKIIPLFQT